MQSKAKIYAANIAKGKIVFNKKKDTYTIICAFNVVDRFPSRVKCDFVSSEFGPEMYEADKERIIALAKAQMRTDTISFA